MKPDQIQEMLKDASVPASEPDRRELSRATDLYVAQNKLLAPLSLAELERHGRRLLESLQQSENILAFVMLLLANASWRPVLSGIAFERRLLLLPLCLRHSGNCPAEVDGVGLLCAECGACDIERIQREAEALGYVVIVAEGTTAVKRLIESGKVDAVVGVGCLDALHRTFPSMVAHAVPGLAIPLLAAGCRDTRVDVDWLMHELHGDRPGECISLPDHDELKAEVRDWFLPDNVAKLLGSGEGVTEQEAQEWLMAGGKRWRPVLAVAAFRCLGGDVSSLAQQPLALAVECFHKASLVHDDIQDDDDLRYGEMSLHCRLGVPLAINVGDYLLGEGYSLISACGCPPELIKQMVCAASEGHLALCRGQGIELAWRRQPDHLSIDDLIEMFALKTSPAFEVALLLGAMAADADVATCDSLKRFSRALGIAYQVRDDLDDADPDSGSDSRALSLLEVISEEGIAEPVERAEQLFEHYRNEALRCLSELSSATLAGLLRRLTVRILRRSER